MKQFDLHFFDEEKHDTFLDSPSISCLLPHIPQIGSHIHFSHSKYEKLSKNLNDNIYDYHLVHSIVYTENSYGISIILIKS